ncbi:UDP-glucose 4-epimerase GalE [bacterium]|nr:UDP-glucose 4-epimerase GalE [bacterium]
MAKILLTGGAGYIGSHTNLALAEAGHKTILFDNLSTGFKELVIAGELIIGDLMDKEAISQILREGGFDAVIHFAAKSLVGESFENPLLYWNTNVIGSLNLIDAMLKYGPRKIVFSSSAAVYGNPSEMPILESCPTKPINPYGKTKLAIEWILQDHFRTLDHVSLRYFNACGADIKGRIGLLIPNDPHLIPVCMDNLLGKRKRVEVFGTDYNTPDGTCIRDYIHVSDLAAAHLSAVEHILSNKTAISLNLGTNRGYSIREIIDNMEKITHKKLNVSLSERRPGDPGKLIADSSCAREFLGWEPRFSDLGIIINSAWEWHKKHFSD